MDLRKSFQLFRRPLHRAVAVGHVELRYVGARTLSGILHVERHGDPAIGCRLRRNFQIGVREARVGEAVAERKQRLNPLFLVNLVDFFFNQLTLHIADLPV